MNEHPSRRAISCARLRSFAARSTPPALPRSATTGLAATRLCSDWSCAEATPGVVKGRGAGLEGSFLTPGVDGVRQKPYDEAVFRAGRESRFGRVGAGAHARRTEEGRMCTVYNV